ncbi:dual specificity protein phosphatase 4-like [Dermatophagoides pteronyssinus]|uniref:dual specificity protein phosphatase 4-like n=1 Tax=Dermatophagoides pteronyssinus TaxID=6956 RepID=UPI003F674D66
MFNTANMIGITAEHLCELLGHFHTLTDSLHSHHHHQDKLQHHSRILLIDCRSFLAHNESHIIHSINVFCPPFLRRRNGTKPLLKTLFPDNLIQDRLLTDFYFHIILYEDHDLTSDSISFYIARCLQEEAGIKYINYLEGGFIRFCNRYPLFCTNTPPLPPKPSVMLIKPSLTKTRCNRTNRRSNYQYIHTWPFRSKSNNYFKPSTPTSLTFYDDGDFPRIFFEDQTEPAELLPYLYLGNECHASSKNLLLNLGITAVLNVSQSCPNHFENEFYYKRIPINDSKCDDITIRINEALNFIDEIKEDRNGKILVHCQAGISRSATICIAYLIKKKRIRMEEAYEFVKSRRQLISPNFNFMTQLMEFEDQIFSDNKQI